MTVALLVSASCGEVGEPDLGSAPTTSIVVDAGAGSQPEPADEPQDAGEAPVQASPPTPEGYVAAVVLSTSAGVLAGEADQVSALATPLDVVAANRSADDFFGGLVVQLDDGRVLWFPAEGGEGEIINADGGSLLDVGFRDGTPEAILSSPGNVIDRVQLVTKERQPLTVLADDRQLLDFSAGAGLFVLVYTDESCGGLLFLNSRGEEVDLPGPGGAPCPVPRRPGFSQVSLSPASDTYVYTEVEYRSDGVEASTHLIGREFSSDVELFRIRIGEAGDRIRSVAFDGRRVVMLRESLDEEVEDGLVIIDTSDPELVIPTAEEEANAVTFARFPLTVGVATES